MLASDAVSYIRNYAGAPSGNQRWSDAQILLFIDRGQKLTVADVLFPESRLSLVTATDRQLYQLPDAHVLSRVYINGQRIAETPGNIDTLEGSQILFNDSTAQGTPSTGSDAPPGAGGSEQPQWTIQTPVAYPYLNSFGSPVPNAQPYSPGQSPRFYRRGGSIGIVPAPTTTMTLVVEGVFVPASVTTTGQTLEVPDNFLEPIVEFALSRMYSADSDPLSVQQADRHYRLFQAELRRLRTWRRQFLAEDAQLLPMTYRGSYRFGQHRASLGGDW